MKKLCIIIVFLLLVGCVTTPGKKHFSNVENINLLKRGFNENKN